MTHLIVCVLLALGPASATRAAHQQKKAPGAESPQATAPAPELTDVEVRERAQAYLGTIDTPIGAARWRALGARGEAVLEEIVSSKENLPTRRAKAVDGIAAIGSAQAPALLLALAKDEAEPFVVRATALRGLGQLFPAAQLAARLGPLVETAKDSRVRAKASEVLARHAPGAACALIQKQVASEPEGVRGQYHSALQRCPAAQ
jgi:HEAT repeat protein